MCYTLKLGGTHVRIEYTGGMLSVIPDSFTKTVVACSRPLCHPSVRCEKLAVCTQSCLLASVGIPKTDTNRYISVANAERVKPYDTCQISKTLDEMGDAYAENKQ